MSQDEKPEAESKALEHFEIKDAEKGEVEAVIATLGVVDRDRDIITPDAIKDGAKVKLSSYGHDAMFGEAPVGKGTVAIEGNKAVFRGKFFLSTQRGKEAYETIKALGTDSEWSFGFRVQGDDTPNEEQQKMGARRVLTKLDAFEVSPVLIGAGIGTRTVAVKEATPEPVEIVESADVITTPEKAEAIAQAIIADATKQVADELEAKRIAAEHEARLLAESASEEFDRFQRTRRWLGAA